MGGGGGAELPITLLPNIDMAHMQLKSDDPAAAKGKRVLSIDCTGYVIFTNSRLIQTKHLRLDLSLLKCSIL